jgi:hypothetical protein
LEATWQSQRHSSYMKQQQQHLWMKGYRALLAVLDLVLWYPQHGHNDLGKVANTLCT